MLRGVHRHATSFARRLEELDGVAGRIVEEDLLAAEAGYDVVAESRTRLAERLNRVFEIVDLEQKAIPAAWLRFATVRHRLGGAAWPVCGVE
jgi:hypothetical protein